MKNGAKEKKTCFKIVEMFHTNHWNLHVCLVVIAHNSLMFLAPKSKKKQKNFFNFQSEQFMISVQEKKKKKVT